MPAHPTHLLSKHPPSASRIWTLIHPLSPVRPHPARHVIARAQQHVAQMRTPRHLAHRVLVPREERHGALARGADVEGADVAVDACGGEGAGAVLVPVVGEGFGGGGGLLEAGGAGACGWGGVERNGEGEVVGGGGRGAEIEEAEVGVGGDGGEEGRGVGGEGGTVGTGVGGEGEEGVGALGGPLLVVRRVGCSREEGRRGWRKYNLDGAIPGA